MLTCFTVMEVPQVIVVVPESQPVPYGQPVAHCHQLLDWPGLTSPCLGCPWLASPSFAQKREDEEAQKAQTQGFHFLSY